MQDKKSSDKFISQVVQLFRDAKRRMSMAVNMAMVYSYYEAGRMIIDEEQNGSERAAYGKYILQELSSRLTQEFGRGFSYENLNAPFLYGIFERCNFRFSLFKFGAASNDC